jgi:hypothetical protein
MCRVKWGQDGVVCELIILVNLLRTAVEQEITDRKVGLISTAKYYALRVFFVHSKQSNPKQKGMVGGSSTS